MIIVIIAIIVITVIIEITVITVTTVINNSNGNPKLQTLHPKPYPTALNPQACTRIIFLGFTVCGLGFRL